MDVPTISVCGLVAYDGTDYHGFQYQLGAPTIQGALESALVAFCDLEGRVVGAGRTDSGVHANGQVIAVRVRWRHSVENLQRAWNAHLPGAVSIRRLTPAPEGFHPRFSALGRTYRYTVVQYSGPVEVHRIPRYSPLTDRYALFEPRALDLATMNEALGHLVGEHDFATFGWPTQGESTVRTIVDACWEVVHCSASGLDVYPGIRLVFTITANGFLRQMVRRLAGILLEVGRGNRSPGSVKTALEARNRRWATPPAPARGLVLERVVYPHHLDMLA